MDKPVCPMCGRELEEEQDFYSGGSRYYCRYCNETFEEDDVDYIDDEEYEDVPEEDKEIFEMMQDDIPDVCESCGGDYPHCKRGCHLLDDD